MSEREASGTGGLLARPLPDLGSAGAAPRPKSAVAKRTLALAKSLGAAQAVAARSLRERDHERMQRRIRRTREAYARLRRAGPAPR
jgi:hypothetical protein